MKPAIDLLFEAVAKKGHVCIGLDTCASYVPISEKQKYQNDALSVLEFNKALIDATIDVCACYKVQIAYYEEMGIEGLRTYSKTLEYIRNKGSLVIADIKRGDIADTAIRYVKAHYSGDFDADFVTISPYMGVDSIDPWLKEAVSLGKGAFVLMRTSNPGMKDFQYLKLDNTNGESKTKRVYNIVGEKLSALASNFSGNNGYGIFGAVVGCTEKDEASEIRKNHPNLFFLIPGYGAQGGGAEDASLLLRNGNGGVVNASRSIITAWQKIQHCALLSKTPETTGNSFAAEVARQATIKMRDEILGVI
jgi:orotidine-5'-phosphate decarboxylase